MIEVSDVCGPIATSPQPLHLTALFRIRHEVEIFMEFDMSFLIETHTTP